MKLKFTAIIPSLLIFGFILFIFPSCEKDCPDGFSGKDCEIPESDAFTGTYEGTENCGFVDQFIEIEIIRDLGPFDVKVNFIETPDFVIKASVRNDSIYFPDQWLATPQNNGQDTLYSIVGKSAGVLYNDTLSFSLYLLFPGISNQEWFRCDYKVYK